jgi:hypothetical protein
MQTAYPSSPLGPPGLYVISLESSLITEDPAPLGNLQVLRDPISLTGWLEIYMWW